MDYLKKNWIWVLVLFVLFFNVGYFTYKHRDNFKIMILINQQTNRINAVESDIKKLDEKIDTIKEMVEKKEEKKPEEKPAERKIFRKN